MVRIWDSHGSQKLSGFQIFPETRVRVPAKERVYFWHPFPEEWKQHKIIPPRVGVRALLDLPRTRTWNLLIRSQVRYPITPADPIEVGCPRGLAARLGRQWQKRKAKNKLYFFLVQIKEEMRTKYKTFSTRASHVVTHRTTGLARIILTSEIGRDRVYYDWYDRTWQLN